MNVKLRKKLAARKQRIRNRIDKFKGIFSSPAINPAAIQYELADKQQAISAGGIGMICELSKKLQLRQTINRAVSIFKLNLPYDEADHVFNIALNLLAGGTCLDHLELRRTDEAYLNAVGAQRIPDPTTAGDFCRRFSESQILCLQDAFNQVRKTVWQQQPREFFDVATIEADGTMVETTGERKQGIGMNYKKQWGYHPLVVTLANTGEPLYVVNRSGSRPSHEQSPQYFDRAINVCRQAGFRKIVLRGDTDFALTENFDRWSEDEVEFIFGIDAMPKLIAIAESLESSAWRPLRRRLKRHPTSPRRRKRPNFKESVVKEKGYLNKKLIGEQIAEFDYQPTKCTRPYRVVAVYKDIEVTQGQQTLFDVDESKYFFYITNASRSTKSDRQVVFAANDRCDQENTISQMKACGALSAPLNDLVSNGAYMVIASLAWSLKIWSALMIKPQGSQAQKEVQAKTKQRVLRMEFSTFRQTLIAIPAQIIPRARRLVYRLLSYRESMEPLFLMIECLKLPLRC